MSDALPDQRRNRIELLTQQVIRPGHKHARFRREKIHGWLGHVRQAVATFLCANMRGDAPVGFLADRPDAVDNFIQESAPVLDALAHHQICELDAAAEGNRFIAAAVTVAHEIEKNRGARRLPWSAEVFLGYLYLSRGHRFRKIGPPVTVGNPWVRMPGCRRDQDFFHFCHRISRAEQARFVSGMRIQSNGDDSQEKTQSDNPENPDHSAIHNSSLNH
jgi:hypothetical protein